MVFVIAEAGVNHNGSEDLALELVNIAAHAGADAIKFQTFTADKLVRVGAEKAEYQKQNSSAGDQHSMLKKLEMSESLHKKLIDKCEQVGIEFMSTAFDEEALDFLLSHGMKRVKVPSGEITNHQFIRHIAAKNVPIILSTGMATIEEIEEAKSVIVEERERHNYTDPLETVLTVLHCTSNYPAEPKDVNLNAMNTIKERINVPVGYSDHTLGITIATGAVALGATVIEKHFTQSRELPGPDHKASLEPAELVSLVESIRTMAVALGSSEKKPTESELPIRKLVRRSVTCARTIKAGETFSKDMLVLMRPGTGIEPKYSAELIGRVASKDLKLGDTLTWDDII